MTDKKSVCFSRTPDSSYKTMFEKNNWNVVDNPYEADLIQFIGGADINPRFYFQHPHKTTQTNDVADSKDFVYYQIGLELKKPMSGICRGAQFLNVMNHGSLYQHVDRHATKKGHKVFDIKTNISFHATSTHHQMMRPADTAIVIGIAYESTLREWMNFNSEKKTVLYKQQRRKLEYDYEILFYPHTRCLCFQPHPEMEEELAKFYFSYLDKYIFGE